MLHRVNLQLLLHFIITAFLLQRAFRDCCAGLPLEKGRIGNSVEYLSKYCRESHPKPERHRIRNPSPLGAHPLSLRGRSLHVYFGRTSLAFWSCFRSQSTMATSEKKDPVCAIVLGMAGSGKSSLVQVKP